MNEYAMSSAASPTLNKQKYQNIPPPPQKKIIGKSVVLANFPLKIFQGRIFFIVFFYVSLSNMYL
jgi:hypothetical protein